MNDPIRRVVANGVDFAYLDEGPADGPLVLLLHGFPDHAPSYRPLLTDLAAAGYHAVAPWMRGYHPTAVPPDGRYQTAVLGLDALALADALAPDKPAIVVGHDWGAAAAYIACAHQPVRFQKLVAIAVPHTAVLAAKAFGNYDQAKRSWYMFFFQLPVLPEQAVAGNDFAFIENLWRDWSPGFEAPPELMKQLKATFAAEGTLEAAIGYYRALFDPRNQDPALMEVQTATFLPVPVPTLYLHGDRDGVIALDMVSEDDLQPLFPAGVKMEVIEGTGHFLHVEKPEVVNPKVIGFLGSS